MSAPRPETPELCMKYFSSLDTGNNILFQGTLLMLTQRSHPHCPQKNNACVKTGEEKKNPDFFPYQMAQLFALSVFWYNILLPVKGKLLFPPSQLPCL